MPKTARSGRKFYNKKRQAARSKRGTRRVSKPLVKAVRVIAKSEALRLQETKFVNVSQTGGSTALLNSVSTPANFINLLPALSQGTADNNRIGNKVMPVYAKSHFTFYYLASQSSNAWNNDIEVNLIIVKAKGYDSANAKANIPTRSLLKNGQGGTTDPDGTTNDQTRLTQVNMYPVNNDLYTVLHRRTFVMRKGIGNQNAAPTGAEVAPTGVPAHEDCYKFSYSWKPPTLEYNQTLDNVPQAHNPMMICWTTNRDASAAYPNMVFYSVSSDLYFKDA